MKKILFTLIALTFILSAKAQTNQKGDTTNHIFTGTDHIPEFPGGMQELYNFLSTNIRYPAISRQKGIQGRVVITMVVEKDGTLSNIRLVRGVATDIDNEALRVMGLSPKWKPGTQNGIPVRVAYAMPINFSLTKN
jgi:protein TonB